MPHSPIIGVTATSEVVKGAHRVRVNASYVRAVERAGGIPLVLPPLQDATHAAELLASVDALVLTGGEDVDPAHFGAAAHPSAGPFNAERDETELALARAAHERRIPTLAICRGIQLLNVALGGSLVQDIPSERPGSIDHDPKGLRASRVHDISVEPRSALASALGATILAANSFHHQSIDAPAAGLRVTARAPDGIIEGVEWTGDDWWALGVQWHPEELDETPESWDRSLFRALMAAATTSTAATR
ncbi:MAG: gamma-glutamyl-gamma-aminobutyrate hydrolase family protein [Gemmatimonadota bacterium]|nr:gamma-glutamyl-gamma-aminobutyrate hydrolase family protein [Gemmatimonadota bacterium]